MDYFISGITTSFLFSNIELNCPSLKISNQYQFSKYFPDDSILFEGKELMSSFNIKSFKNILSHSLLQHNVFCQVLLKLMPILRFHQIRISPYLKLFSLLYQSHM